jgi:xanthine dehydrogenase accessory factor
MNIPFNPNPTGTDPIRAILNSNDDAVLAIIAGVEGPSYRPVGAMMTVMPDRTRIGTLSSGCIESDIALHADDVRQVNAPRLLRYGIGSPFADIILPCGGGLDILLLPRPDKRALETISSRIADRDGCSLRIDLVSGAMTVLETGETGRTDTELTMRFDPALRFLVFGKGPEASTFAALVTSAGYPSLLLSSDAETMRAAEAADCPTQMMLTKRFPDNLGVDGHTAIVLFFHDHDWEPPILKGALETQAFYIGAQGSLRARAARDATLKDMGVTGVDIMRLRGPVGLIPSARDAGTLAVSVLAEILATAMQTADSGPK